MTVTAARAVSAPAFLDDLAEVVEEVRAGAAHRDSTRSYAVAEIDRLREIGFWALTVPVEHGGLGLGPDTLVQAILSLAAADGSLGQVPQNHFMSVERIRLATSGRQRAHWLDALGGGAVLGNATAEPGERPPGERSTTLLPHPEGGWVLEGRKVYSTGSLLADAIAVVVRLPDGQSANVLVRGTDAGVTLEDDWEGLGQRTTASGTSVFRGVRVDDLAYLAPETDPVATYRISALGQLLHAAIDTGIAEGALAEALRLAGTAHGGRGSGARAFADDVLGVALLGELKVATLAARRVVESAAARLAALHEGSALEETVDVFYEVAAAKLVSTRAALQVTTGLFDVGGTSSTLPSHGLDRYWRDARTHTLHDAVRWKPHSIGRWILEREVADPWSIGHPLRHLEELRVNPQERDAP